MSATPEWVYPFTWRVMPEGLVPFFKDKDGVDTRAIWAPQQGSQVAFLGATSIFEVLFEGTRGPGKTDSLLMDFYQHVGKGYGEEWKGIIFRQTFPQLADIISKSMKWFKQVCPAAVYNKSEHKWTFPDGEVLYFRHMLSPDDYWNFHGHSYPYIGWEELTTWADDKCYKVMMSCCRSTRMGMPRCYRATANPYGVGHNWVKKRFRLPEMRGKIVRGAADDPSPLRVAIHGRLSENKILLHADPDYINKIRAAARNPAELAAWIDGSWDIVAGGMFDDIWEAKAHVIPSIPAHLIPKRWKIDRTFDWGSSKPFAVLWWAESNGEPFEFEGRTYGRVAGDTIAIREWYGWNGTRNEGIRALASDIAIGIRDREDDWGLKGRVRVGAADSAIYDEENGTCIADDMAAKGVHWVPVEKGPGSRKQGWEQVRTKLKGALPLPGMLRELPGLFISLDCPQTIETFPGLPRSDKDLDDVDTNAEDHLGDCVRYRIRRKLTGAKQQKGMTGK